MIINIKTVNDIIKKRPQLNALYKPRLVSNLLGGFSISDYIPNDLIPTIINEFNETEKNSPSVFFKNRRYLCEIIPNKSIEKENPDFYRKFKENMSYENNFSIHLFDTFLVVEIVKSVLEKEFIVLTPNKSNPMECSSIMTTIIQEVLPNPIRQYHIYLEIDHLLTYLAYDKTTATPEQTSQFNNTHRIAMLERNSRVLFKRIPYTPTIAGIALIAILIKAIYYYFFR